MGDVRYELLAEEDVPEESLALGGGAARCMLLLQEEAIRIPGVSVAPPTIHHSI